MFGKCIDKFLYLIICDYVFSDYLNYSLEHRANVAFNLHTPLT